MRGGELKMALIRWNPWSLDRMFDDDFEMPTFPGLSRLAGQGLNIYETEDSVVAEAALPGIPEDKIDVSVDKGVVRISGSTSQNEEDKTGRRYFMSSMSESFNYAFRLPEGLLESGEPEAEVDNGVLRLIFKKAEKVPPKKISVRKKAK